MAIERRRPSCPRFPNRHCRPPPKFAAARRPPDSQNRACGLSSPYRYEGEHPELGHHGFEGPFEAKPQMVGEARHQTTHTHSSREQISEWQKRSGLFDGESGELAFKFLAVPGKD